MRKCTIIGISDSRNQWLPPQATDAICNGRVFSGGKRHYEIMGPKLPPNALWIDICVPLSAVFEQYAQHDEIVIFASGDPLFYGFATTVQRECKDCEINVIPTFNSIQLLAHQLKMPYHNLVTVSLTGRAWDGLDCALIKGEGLIGCLTDHQKTPHSIWQRLVRYGYTNYQMFVGVKLGNETHERVCLYDENDVYDTPNCVLLKMTHARHQPFGLPDNEFKLLNGRSKMITKMPIRLFVLSALDLVGKTTFWDVGFCTGSVSIEAKLHFPHLHITAFEVRPEGRDLMDSNSTRFGTPGIEVVIADFMKTDLSEYRQPEAVFIGGHGGQLKQMILKIKNKLADGGCIVFNSVSTDSLQQFKEGATEAGMNWTLCGTITLDDNNSITTIKAE
ncbi:MAG: precorrin-6y C5,15-methyltransferase (decarboxylating) subunit CbiE [Paludibacteraceae bacterium]|nr:precorrin-6y C5,15-methyltransferase (decarboxylating) subunit CbiE [Paludibacteraceae bacterium]